MPKVDVYTTPACAYCAQVRRLLRDKDVAFNEIDDAPFDPAKKRAMVERTGGRSTFPQVFIGERYVGGCDDVMALERTGELDVLLAG